MNKKLVIFTLILVLVTLCSLCAEAPTEGASDTKIANMNMQIQGSTSFVSLLIKWLANLGWILVASIGFAVGIGVSLLIFDLFTPKFDEWEEIKKGNIGAALILIVMIVMIGLIVLKVI